MKKALIYMRENKLAKTGGPAGYNYALKSQLDKLSIKDIEFIHTQPRQEKPYWGTAIRATWYGSILKTIRDFFRVLNQLYGPFKKSEVDLGEYDIVHFHDPRDMYLVKDSLKKYRGKVLLTSHSPQVGYKEKKDILRPWAQKHMSWFFDKMEKFDLYAFNRADYIVFPCESAEEPYYHSWNKYEEIKRKKRASFKYLLTGTYRCEAKLTRKEICERYSIPNNAFIVCFVGRHNEIKGYDLLKNIGEQLLTNNENIYILVAGVEHPLKGIQHPRWIEVGWTNDPHSIIAASDVFVLPNRETYFDLIMLEVLSLGKIVVASNTGGNQYFTKDKTDGVFLYNSTLEAVSTIEELKKKDPADLANYAENNSKFFEDELSVEVFAQNYISMINEILDEGEK